MKKTQVIKDIGPILFEGCVLFSLLRLMLIGYESRSFLILDKSISQTCHISSIGVCES